MSQRFEGHNLEDALNSAAAGLGVERYQITHRVIVEKRGFLGGIKRIVIEADVNPDATQPSAAAEQQPAFTSNPVSAPPSRDARPARSGRGGGGGGGRRDRGDRGRRGDRPERGGRGDRHARGRSGPRRDSGNELRPGDFEIQFTGEVPEQGAESDTAREVRTWCERVVSLATLDLVVRTEENDQQILVRFYGADSPRLTDRNGELLDAMQVIANKALVGRKTEKEIEFDCQKFKEHRTEELGQRAREIADRVRRDGREQLLPAMSPIERRIVHLALHDDAEVTTESRGEGFYKRVAIIPRPDAEAGSES